MKRKMAARKQEPTKIDENGLSERQKAAIPFFLGSNSYEENCRQAGISKAAFFDWLKNPYFKGELDRAREAVVDEAIGVLKANVTKASSALAGLLEKSNNPAIIRGVANDIIGHVFKVKELQEFEKRLMALEQLFEARKTI
jgi:hypothetical protein